jgi:hypothetical protein
VRDQNDRQTVRFHPKQQCEQAIGFLRREDSRGLVQDEDTGAKIERLHNLHPLLLADRQILDHRVKRNLQHVPLA